MARIPRALHEHINTAFPANVCLVATVLPSGFAQVSPRGSTMVFDDEHLGLWERGRGSTSGALANGTKITVFLMPAVCRAYFRRNRLERLRRDVQAQFHPLPEARQLVFTWPRVHGSGSSHDGPCRVVPPEARREATPPRWRGLPSDEESHHDD